MSYRPTHFYIVFNPLLGYNSQDYKTQAHEFYARLKEQWINKQKEPHLFWGKIRKTKTNSKLEIAPFEKIIIKNRQNNNETFLFITDHSHLWVAKIESVQKNIDDMSYALELYKLQEVEMWFKISEIDLISSNPKETLNYISLLYTEDIESLNPYLSGLRYPLAVQDLLEEKYFSKSEKNESRMLKKNPEITDTASSMRKTITSYAIPDNHFSVLPSVIRNEILSIEIEFLELDQSFGMRQYKMHKIATAYIQIVESILNTTLISEFKNDNAVKTQLLGLDSVDKKRAKFYNEKSLSLNEIEKIIDHESYDGLFNTKNFLKKSGKSEFFNFMSTELKAALNKKYENGYAFKDLRNDDAHLKGGIELSIKESTEIRNLVLGVGCTGLINTIIEKWHNGKAKCHLKIAA